MIKEMDMTNSTQAEQPSDVRSAVREHYGKAASDFKPTPTRCCGAPAKVEAQPQSNSAVSQIYETPEVNSLPEDVTGLSMGCGDPITLASLKRGQNVLDLGSGGGIDCFLAAKKVGKTGKVIGVDMTAEMLEKARANKVKLGVPNVDFRLGEIENLPVADQTVDLIISNCVINLSPDKEQVFREAFRVLKPGGHVAVSDIVLERPMPPALQKNLAAWASCIAGAVDKETYQAAMEAAGFVDVQITLTPIDKTLVEDALKQAGVTVDATSGKRTLVVNDSCGFQAVELERSDLPEGGSYAASARITARKPE